MNRGRTEPFTDLWLKPLLDLAENYPSPEVQLAAIKAAARFPLGRAGWEKMIDPAWRLIMRLPPGSSLRRRTLVFAAGVPLRTVRDELCRMADDPDEHDREVIVDALESVGDPSRIHALLMRASQGDPELWRRLAMAPLEHSGLDYHEIREYARKLDTDARFWLALAVGRLGNYARLEDTFAPGAPVPTLFRGSPWTAYERIAAIRPVPERLHGALLDMLARLDETRVSQEHDLVRALRITVWAATGIADAEGSPLLPPPAFGPIRPPASFRSDPGAWAILREHLTANRPTFDDGQIAWMIAETPTEALIAEAVGLVHQSDHESERLHLLDILGRAADCQAGRASTPFRGAGGGSSAPFIQRAMIDDRPMLGGARPPSLSRAPKPAARQRETTFDIIDNVDLVSAARSAPAAAPEMAPPASPAPSAAPRHPRGITIDTRHVEYETAPRSAAPRPLSNPRRRQPTSAASARESFTPARCETPLSEVPPTPSAAGSVCRKPMVQQAPTTRSRAFPSPPRAWN